VHFSLSNRTAIRVRRWSGIWPACGVGGPSEGELRWRLLVGGRVILQTILIVWLGGRGSGVK